MPLVLDRRTFLRGAALGATAAIGLPTLEAMLDPHGEALASGAPLPRRLGVFFFGNGVRLDRWTPSATGANYPLSEALRPLVNVRDHVNVVSGYRAKAGYGRRGHHDGCAAILSGIPFIELPHESSSYSSKFGGPSIDQVAADRIGAGTTFPSVQLAVSKRVIGSEGPTLRYLSHRGPDSPLEPEFSPRAVFQRLFGNFTPASTTDPTAGLRSNVLDLVKDDLRRLEARLGTLDRQRLDAHLTGISQLQREIAALPPMVTTQCALPGDPGVENVDADGNEPLEAVSRAMADLVAVAFACDLTRVVTLQLTGSVGYTTYHMFGQTRGNHDLSHEASERDAVHAGVVWNVQQFAYLLEKLKATPEARGTLLDSSVWLFTSDVAEGETHSSDDYPILVAGGGGGALKYPGVHHRGTTQDNTSDVLLTVLRAAGTGLTEVGADQGHSSQPCRAIEA
jgi:hypothetical protein